MTFVLAGCAVLGLFVLNSIDDQLRVIARELQKRGGK